jgi:hypothetical protein
MANSVTTQFLNAVKGRKFTSVQRLFTPNVDFQAWNPSGHWIANDASTAAKIIEVWFSPGVNSQITFSRETGSKANPVLEAEITWATQPDDQPRCLRQVYLLTVKGDRIAAARVYCAGLHTDFPEVDLEKQRRAKGIGGLKPPAPKAITARSVQP